MGLLNVYKFSQAITPLISNRFSVTFFDATKGIEDVRTFDVKSVEMPAWHISSDDSRVRFGDTQYVIPVLDFGSSVLKITFIETDDFNVTQFLTNQFGLAGTNFWEVNKTPTMNIRIDEYDYTMQESVSSHIYAVRIKSMSQPNFSNTAKGEPIEITAEYSIIYELNTEFFFPDETKRKTVTIDNDALQQIMDQAAVESSEYSEDLKKAIEQENAIRDANKTKRQKQKEREAEAEREKESAEQEVIDAAENIKSKNSDALAAAGAQIQRNVDDAVRNGFVNDDAISKQIAAGASMAAAKDVLGIDIESADDLTRLNEALETGKYVKEDGTVVELTPEQINEYKAKEEEYENDLQWLAEAQKTESTAEKQLQETKMSTPTELSRKGLGDGSKNFEVTDDEIDANFEKIQKDKKTSETAKKNITKEKLKQVQEANAEKMAVAYTKFQNALAAKGYKVSLNDYNRGDIHAVGFGTTSGSHTLGQKMDVTIMDSNGKLVRDNISQEDIDAINAAAAEAGLITNFESDGSAGSFWGDMSLAEAMSIDKDGNIVESQQMHAWVPEGYATNGKTGANKEMYALGDRRTN